MNVSGRLKFAKCRDGKERSPITGICMTPDELQRESQSRDHNFLISKYGVMNLEGTQQYLPPWMFKGGGKGIGFSRFIFSECLKNGIQLQKQNSKGLPMYQKNGEPKFKTITQLKKECLVKYETSPPVTEDKMLMLPIGPVPKSSPLDNPSWWVPKNKEVSVDNKEWSRQVNKDTWNKIIEIIKKINDGQQNLSTDNLTTFEQLLLEICVTWIWSKEKEQFLENLENIYEETFLSPSQIRLLTTWVDILILSWNCTMENKNRITELLNTHYGGDPLPEVFIRQKLCPIKKNKGY